MFLRFIHNADYSNLKQFVRGGAGCDRPSSHLAVHKQFSIAIVKLSKLNCQSERSPHNATSSMPSISFLSNLTSGTIPIHTAQGGAIAPPDE